jgi:excisionase family DNA binding protein
MTGVDCLGDGDARFFTPKEIANLLRLSERQIRREIAAGRLKVHCFGRAIHEPCTRVDFSQYCNNVISSHPESPRGRMEAFPWLMLVPPI